MKIDPLAKTLSFLILLALPAALSACDAFHTAALPAATAVQQPAVQTAGAWLSPARTVAAPAALVMATIVPSVPSVASPQPSSPATTLPPGRQVVSAGSQVCDRVSPGLPIDVTMPDGVLLQPGQTFSKTWRLVNAGQCAWSRDYAVVFFSGQPMGMAGQQMISSEVLPGETIDITVDMIAPQEAGSYQSNWKLRNQAGQLFGLGPNGDSPFWVQIEVAATESSLAAAPLPSTTPTLPVFSSGMVNLLPTDRLDLDSGSLNQDDSVDVAYLDQDPTQPTFNPSNGARLSVYGSAEPDETACQTGVLSADTVVLEGVETGLYLCYRTSQGLPGYLHVVRPAPEEAALSLDFVTWTVP